MINWRLFHKTQELLAELTHVSTQVAPGEASEVSHKESECEEKLKKLSPDDESGFTTLQTDLKAAITKFRAMIPPPAVPPEAAINPEPAQAPSGEGRARASKYTRPEAAINADNAEPAPLSRYRQISAVPGLAHRGWLDKIIKIIPPVNRLALVRSCRLKLMGWLGYVFPASVFVYTGFSQLYLANPTFGLLSDYVALFLWGFGSDAGGSKVQDLMRLTNNGAKEAVIERATNRAAGDRRAGRDAGGPPSTADNK